VIDNPSKAIIVNVFVFIAFELKFTVKCNK